MTVAQYDKSGKILKIREIPKQEKNQMKDLGLVKPSTFDEVETGKLFYYVNACGWVEVAEAGKNCSAEEELLKIGNYNTNEKLMEQRALHETLDRLLWRFACENNAYDTGHRTYTSIYYKGNMEFAFLETEEAAYNSYFYPAEVAMEAVREVVIPFMKEHSDFVW